MLIRSHLSTATYWWLPHCSFRLPDPYFQLATQNPHSESSQTKSAQNRISDRPSLLFKLFLPQSCPSVAEPSQMSTKSSSYSSWEHETTFPSFLCSRVWPQNWVLTNMRTMQASQASTSMCSPFSLLEADKHTDLEKPCAKDDRRLGLGITVVPPIRSSHWDFTNFYC